MDPKTQGIRNFRQKMVEKRHKKRFPEDEAMGVSVEADSPEALEEGLELAQEVLPEISEAAQEGKANAVDELDKIGINDDDDEAYDRVGEDFGEDELGVEEGEVELEDMLRGFPIEEIEDILAKLKSEEM